MSKDKDKDLVDLITKATEAKVISNQPKLVKPADINSMPELKEKVLKLSEGGFTANQIAAALGFDEEQIKWCLEDKPELGTAEEILQTGLKTLVALIPLADATYRQHPSFHNSMALTGLIDSSRSVLQDLTNLKDREETFAIVLQQVLQPMMRQMIGDLMDQFRFFSKSFDGLQEKSKLELDLQSVALNVGKKYDEAYRRASDVLAELLNVNPDAKMRVQASMALSDD